MAAKKTIAIVGATEETGIEMATRFAQSNSRLLLVSNDVQKLERLSHKITNNKITAEIDTAECVKDGCWEADIIILAVASHEEKAVAEIMKEVSTQKIVVGISEGGNEPDELQQILPYSKLVHVSNILKSRNILISGKEKEANEEILDIFLNAGYQAAIADNNSNHKIESKTTVTI